MRPQDYIPARWRLAVRRLYRYWQDRQNGYHKAFAPTGKSLPVFPSQLTLTQAIKRTSSYAAKLHNFETATAEIQRVVVAPGQIFSFWRTVGAPTYARGYQEGRTLIGGLLKPTVGGGLCQLAGMLYYLGLQAGLEIIERHHHSVDIYTDATRYTPLGSDATVVFGYKDLRMRNTLDQPLSFRFDITPEQITLTLASEAAIAPLSVHFQTLPTAGNKIGVETLVAGNSIGMALYRSLPQDTPSGP